MKITFNKSAPGADGAALAQGHLPGSSNEQHKPHATPGMRSVPPKRQALCPREPLHVVSVASAFFTSVQAIFSSQIYPGAQS